MRKLVYYIGTSIDGYIAGPNHEIDFFPLADDILSWITANYPETVPTHLRDRFGIVDVPNQRFDTAIMGRGTYQPALDIGIRNPYQHLRQFVVSTTLAGIADDGIEVVPSDPVGLVRRLKNRNGMDIWLAGGGQLASAVLREIDELIVKLYPVAAGSGVPVFHGEFQPTLFDMVDLRTFKSGAAVVTYRPAGVA